MGGRGMPRARSDDGKAGAADDAHPGARRYQWGGAGTCFWWCLGRSRGGTVATRVTMADGTEHSLPDHLREQHQKGTRGCTGE
jgi:hypothetical protein